MKKINATGIHCKMCPFSFQNTLPHYPGLCFFFSASLAFVFSFMTVLSLTRCNIVQDIPNDRSSHVTITPTLGGLGFVIPILLTAFWSQPWVVFVGLLLIAALGVGDDMYGLSYRVRLAVQCIVGALLITGLGSWVMFFSWPLFVVVALTLFLIVGIINGVNFIDGLNGLLSGCVMMAIITWWIAMPSWSSLWLVSFSSLLAFWIINRRGNIFMGDVGSTFLGVWVCVIALSMQEVYPESALGGLCTQGFVIALAPLMFVWGDVSFTLCHRWWRREVLSQGHRDHLIHRLVDQGYSHACVTTLYMLGTLFMGGMTLAYVWGAMQLGFFVSIYLIFQMLLGGIAFRCAS